jgi:hypothetical protein
LDFSSALTGGKLVLDSWFLIASNSIPVPDDDFPSAIPANHQISKFNKKPHTKKEATAHFTNKKTRETVSNIWAKTLYKTRTGCKHLSNMILILFQHWK